MPRLIDADALRDRLQNLAYDDWNQGATTTWAEAFYACADIVAEAPTIEPEPHWIPCSERLPEELEEVNVTWVNHKPEPYYDFVKDKPFTASAVYYKGDWYWYSSICADLLVEYGKNEIDKIDGAIEIMAWMPLPEPYREGEGC